jgi:hypothetical protein
MPQVPQLALSARVFTSQPLLATRSQSAKPGSQAITAHAPAAQAGVAWASRHARPQPPQCAALDVVTTSQPLAAAPSQSPKPAAQRTTAHSPPVQPWVWVLASAQLVPHAPQFAGSIDVFAQKRASAGPQVVAGVAQVVPQTPPEHTRPAAQGVVQSPQWALSVWRLKQLSPHWVSPALHETAQAPLAQVLPGGQALPHAPQWALSVARSRQVPPQSRCVPAQESAQAPSTQAWPAAHATPQAPQLSRSVRASAQ